MSRRRAYKILSLVVVAMLTYVAAKAAPQKPPTAAMVSQASMVKVTKISDGDTIEVEVNGVSEKVRLIGVDTPETHDPRKPVQCFGKAASDWTTQTLTGRSVRLEADPSQGERDKYDRLLAYVWRDDGLFINQTLIKEGYAHEYTYQTPYKYQQTFRGDERQAREQSRGLWAADTCGGDTKQPAR
ncbi:thermonuclease family protein [bacterium]|nr:thermonuclease family protein [bacterium]